MKNIEEKILMAEEEIKQLQNKRKKLISQQKEEERKKRDRRLYEKGGVFESIFTESKELTKDEFYQLISSLNHRICRCSLRTAPIIFYCKIGSRKENKSVLKVLVLWYNKNDMILTRK